jgi:hypothetical protein
MERSALGSKVKAVANPLPGETKNTAMSANSASVPQHFIGILSVMYSICSLACWALSMGMDRHTHFRAGTQLSYWELSFPPIGSGSIQGLGVGVAAAGTFSGGAAPRSSTLSDFTTICRPGSALAGL